MLLPSQHQHHHLHPSIHGYCYTHSHSHSTFPLLPKTLPLFIKKPHQPKPFISSPLHHNHHPTSHEINKQTITPNTQQHLRKHNANSTTFLRRRLSLQEKELEQGLETNADMAKLKQALAIRRQITYRLLKISMTNADFPPSYCTKLLPLMPQFIDHVVIEAASMKHLPEFENSSFSTRVETSIQKSNVVEIIRWLKDNSLSYLKIATLICMSCGNLELVRSKVDWLKTIRVEEKTLGFVFSTAGVRFLRRSIDELDELIGYLESNGVGRGGMGFIVKRCPQILALTMEEVRSRVAFYLDMGMSKEDFGKMVFDSPKSFGSLTQEEMTCKVNYLKEFGLSHDEVGRLVAIKSSLMVCSIEESWKPLVKYLYCLGVCLADMRRILTLEPTIFCIDLETEIVPKVLFLHEIGIREKAIGNMIVIFPTFLTYSIKEQILPVVDFLMTNAGVTQKDIRKVIEFSPELLGCTILELELNVKYFLSLGIHLPLLGEMIASFPTLLSYSLEALQSKYQYLQRTMDRPLQELIEFPRFFSYSLDGRIIPRHMVMVENGVNFKLRYMLACSDEEFSQRVEDAVERRRHFESASDGFGTLGYSSTSKFPVILKVLLKKWTKHLCSFGLPMKI